MATPSPVLKPDQSSQLPAFPVNPRQPAARPLSFLFVSGVHSVFLTCPVTFFVNFYVGYVGILQGPFLAELGVLCSGIPLAHVSTAV